MIDIERGKTEREMMNFFLESIHRSIHLVLVRSVYT